MKINGLKLLGPSALGVLLWFIPAPGEMPPAAWHLLIFFLTTITCIILNPYPMGVISVLAITVALITRTIEWEDVRNGFGNDIVWLIVFVFFVAKALISTGLGNRIAYSIMRLTGKNSLGLGYGIAATNFLMAPCIPSVTARAGGIIFPVIRSLDNVFSGKLQDSKIGSFLTLCAYQSMAITSAMFLTAMAGNPMIVMFAQDASISISWSDWAVAALIPGVISLLVLPWFIHCFWAPSVRNTPYVTKLAREKLREMGPIRFQEKIMIAVMLFLIFFWIGGHFIGLKEAVVAMAGVSILLLTGIVKWKDVLEEQSAWDTLLWFSSLIILAAQLNKTGFSTWFSEAIVGSVEGFSWGWGLALLVVIYFYTHYFFASAVAHIGAMYTPFLMVALAIGTPPQLAALVFAFASNLNIGLTHYGSGSAPILFSSGYVSVKLWWKVGFLFSLVLLLIWSLVGAFWWKALGIW
jgi:DASS family divalent anion:Na+ symporter